MNQVLQNAPIEFSQSTKLAIDAAIHTRDKILKIYETDFKTHYKADREPFTLADTASEEIIIRQLTTSGYPVLAEESNNRLAQEQQKKFWIVDPLDGTADFIEKTGEFSVMIALMENNRPIIGVVYQPTQNKLYVAEQTRGAFLHSQDQWQRLQVSAVADLISARAVMSRHHLSVEEISVLEKFGVEKITRMGSAGLKAGFIAEGKADFYFTLTNKIKVWDTAAGECLVIEAGGKVTDTQGDVLIYDGVKHRHSRGVVVSNGNLNQEIIKKI